MKKTLLFIFLLSVTMTYGQFKAPKFGKIDPGEISLTRYDKDTAAAALYLFDDGNCYFKMSNEGNFQIVFERHCRIKIFKKSAFELANFKIRLYQAGSRKESISQVNAATFNMENGKLVQTKLEKENIFEESARNYTVKKFAFPQVKEGSILDFSYTITSDFLYTFRGWTFQTSYPALWSQYKTSIPEYFDYRPASKGYLAFTKNSEDQGSTTFNFTVTTSTPGGGAPERRYETVQPLTKNHLYAIADVPAFKSEPNIDCDDNYIQSIEFEISSVQFPYSPRQPYTESWEAINKQLSEDEDLGKLLKSGGFISDTVSMVCKGLSTDLEKATAIYRYVQKRMKWNGVYSMWALNGLKKAYKEHTGNSAEINVLLALMLKTAGLQTNLVVFSTRDNGISTTFFPSTTRFNSVLAQLTLGEKYYLMDASDENCPMGLLPANDINGTGRVINDLQGDWVDLTANSPYKERKNYLLKINSDGSFSGYILSNYDGYAAMSYRSTLKSLKSSDDFIRKVQEHEKGLAINGYQIMNKAEIEKPVIDSMQVTITDHADVMGDKIMFTPLLLEAQTKNSYTLEERSYPINYNYPRSETVVFDYTLPDGYVVESLPKPVRFKLPDGSIGVTYLIQNEGNKISVLYKRDITKILFLPDEYAGLKEFYNQIVKVHSEKIILKKA